MGAREFQGRLSRSADGSDREEDRRRRQGTSRRQRQSEESHQRCGPCGGAATEPRTSQGGQKETREKAPQSRLEIRSAQALGTSKNRAREFLDRRVATSPASGPRFLPNHALCDSVRAMRPWPSDNRNFQKK